MKFTDEKDGKKSASIWSYDGTFHTITKRYYDKKYTPLFFGEIIRMKQSTKAKCPFPTEEYDNLSTRMLKQTSVYRLKEIKSHGGYDIPKNAHGCLKVSMEIESDGEIDRTKGTHIVFFDEFGNMIETNIFVLKCAIEDIEYINPFYTYNWDCEEFEIAYGINHL